MIDDLFADATRRMDSAVEHTQQEFNSVRTGRASPHLLDRLVVEAYGAQSPIKQLAQVNATDARLLTASWFQRRLARALEAALVTFLGGGH